MPRPAYLIVGVAAAAFLGGCGEVDSPASVTPTPEASALPSASPVRTVDSRPLESQLIEAVRAHDLDYVAALIDAGADVNAPVPAGGSILHLAVAQPDAEVTEALLAAGADLNAVTPAGISVIARAAEIGTAETMRVLLAAGADPLVFANDWYGSTALHIAARVSNNEVLRVFLEAGYGPDVADEYYGAFPLATAAFVGNVEGCELLYDYGADVSAVDRSGATPLTYALSENRLDVAEFLQSVGAA